MVPKVTVLMTVYNGLPYLGEAIASILEQTFKDFEFLIIDDASTDGSRSLIESYTDARIRLICNEKNMGQTSSLNKGLHLAIGEYVARLDQDDIALPERLEKQVSYMVQHPQVVLLGTWCEFIDEVGNHVRYYRPPTSHQAIVDAFAIRNPFAHPSIMFRRAPVQEMGGYPADYPFGQDLALWQRLGYQYRVANLPEELVQIRVHSGQATRRTDMTTARCWDQLRLSQQALVLARPGLSQQARRKSQRRAAYATLHYAETLSHERRRRASLRWVITLCLRYPHLCVQDPGIRTRMGRLLVGPRGLELWHSMKKHLHRALPMRNLDNP